MTEQLQLLTFPTARTGATRHGINRPDANYQRANHQRAIRRRGASRPNASRHGAGRHRAGRHAHGSSRNARRRSSGRFNGYAYQERRGMGTLDAATREIGKNGAQRILRLLEGGRPAPRPDGTHIHLRVVPPPADLPPVLVPDISHQRILDDLPPAA